MYCLLAVIIITSVYGTNICKNCIYFKPAPNLKHYTDYNIKWSKCHKFNDYTDYCREEESLCGATAKSFMHKDYANSLIDIYVEYADLILKKKSPHSE